MEEMDSDSEEIKSVHSDDDELDEVVGGEGD